MIGLNLCTICKHNRAIKFDDKWTCAAFPKEIPKSIYTGEQDHRQPIAGDNDIQFEPIDK